MKRAFLVIVLLVSGLQAAPVEVLLAATMEELQPLLVRMPDKKMEKRASWQFWTGTLSGKSVALTCTEGGPLNAVAATTLAIRRYSPKLVITFGSARGHDPALQPGDVVVSEKFAAFDGMVSPHRDLGTGSSSLDWHRLPHPLMTAGEKENRIADFPADQAALAVAKKLTAPRGRIVTGVLGSAHQVNREADRIAWIRTQWGTSSEDAESAHVAGCALLLRVPAIGLRVIDGADGEAAALVAQFLEARK